MSGPTTRPIRDDRPRMAAIDDHRQEERDRHKGREPDGAPKDFADQLANGGDIKAAALRQFFKHCGTCGAVFLLCVAWMLNLIPSVDSPFAMAEDFARVKSVFNEVLTRQISADIRDYQDSLCRGRNPFLEGELERAQVAYEKQTGRRYPLVTCPARN